MTLVCCGISMCLRLWFLPRLEICVNSLEALTLTLPKRRTAQRERGLTDVFFRGAPTQTSSRAPALKYTEIGSLSPSPPGGGPTFREGWGEVGI
jgi:hypothetical protein